MKVLHVSYTGAMSGGEHSLLTLLAAMPAEVELGVACPDGALDAAVRRLGLPVHRIPATSVTFRLHPVRTARGLAEMGAAALAVSLIARRQGATVIHANHVRTGLITSLAGAGSCPPAVVHVRDVLPDGPAGSVVKRALTSRSAGLVGISRYVKEKFGAGGEAMTVIDNPVDLRRFDPGLHDRADGRRALGADLESPLIGIVGQITPWKGHDTAIRALVEVRARHPAARLVVVGEVKFSSPGTSFDNRGYLAGLHRLVCELGLSDAVSFLGERTDIHRVLRALDVLLVPSTVEPFGRTVAEAMTMATPVIATSEGGPADLIDHGVTGLLAAPGDHRAWEAAVDRVLGDRDAARQMAEAARTVALRRFAPERHLHAMLAVFASASAG